MTLARRNLRSLWGPGTGLAALLTLAAARFPPSAPSPAPSPATTDSLNSIAFRLTASDGWIRRRLLAITPALPSLRIHLRSADVTRREAAEALLRTPERIFLLPGELAAALRTASGPATADAVRQCLTRLDPDLCLSRILPLALDPDPAVQTRGLELILTLLRDTGPPTGWSPALASGLQGALTAQAPEARKLAAEALGLLRGDARGTLPALLQCVGDPAPAVRGSVAETLGLIAASPDACVPALTRLLHDPSPEVRQPAARALGRWGTAASGSVPSLVNAIDDASTPVALAAVTALGRIGPASEPAVPRITLGLDHPAPVLRAACATALGRIARDTAHSTPALARALRDDDAFVRSQAVRALAALGPDAAPAVDALIQALRDPVESVHVGAVDALGRIGPAAAAAVPELNAARNNNQSVMTRPVLIALSGIAGTSTSPAGSRASHAGPVPP